MTAKMMHVKGSLVPANPEMVTGSTAHRMTTEMIRHRLITTLLNPNESMAKWDKGAVECDTRSETNGGGRPAAMDFITRLHNVVTAAGIKELGLSGELMVTVEAVKEPVVVRVTVENGNVLYNEAKLVWEDEPVAFM
jgi:hypothetical protein